MIVTCPGCASKYRVRNEAVPSEGARMRCPKCETLFLAKPPAAGEASNEDFGAPAAAPTLAPPAPAPVAAPSPFQAQPQPFQPQPFQPGFSVAPPVAAPSPFGPPSGAVPAPSPFGAPAPSPFAGPSPFGAGSPFGAPPPMGAPSPFGGPTAASPFGQPGPQPGTPVPFGAASPFGAPAPSPFGAPPGFGAPSGPQPFPAARAQPFGAPPQPSTPPGSPFGAPPQPAPFSPFDAPSTNSGAQTAPPRATGPLTGMMQNFDANSLVAQPSSSQAPSPSTPARSDEDPFASLDIMGGPTTNTSERPRPTTQTPQRLTTSTASSPGASPPPARVVRGPSMAGTIGSWVVLAAAAAATIFGITFAGWTSESLDLDASLMPTFEANFGVRPPKSFHGADDVPLDELRRLAQAKETQGDLAGAAVAWRRVQDRDPNDKTAVAALPRVMTALGDRLR